MLLWYGGFCSTCISECYGGHHVNSFVSYSVKFRKRFWSCYGFHCFVLLISFQSFPLGCSWSVAGVWPALVVVQISRTSSCCHAPSVMGLLLLLLVGVGGGAWNQLRLPCFCVGLSLYNRIILLVNLCILDLSIPIHQFCMLMLSHIWLHLCMGSWLG